ncbi:MAG: hypothetical protein ACRERD_20470, partial [Candidatus Binatia bacterium]
MTDKSMGFSIFGRDRGLDAVLTKLGQSVDRLSKKLDELDRKVVDPQIKIDTKKAEAQVGAFAAAMQRRLERAIQALPDVELKADASDVDRRIAGIRVELKEIADKRIGIGIDDAVARKRIEKLTAELIKLGSSSPSIRVQADTADASAELTAIEAHARRLDVKDIELSIDVDTVKVEEKLGAFAEAMQRRLERAVQALPNVELKADASDVDRRIANIRAELQSLGDKRIGVDIDADEAQDQIERLRRELVLLGS